MSVVTLSIAMYYSLLPDGMDINVQKWSCRRFLRAVQNPFRYRMLMRKPGPIVVR